MDEPLRFRTRLCLSVLLIVSTLVLSGCARPVRGQSMASAEAAINAVEGLSGETRSGGVYSGVFYQRWSSVRVTLEEKYEVAEWDELLVWLMQTVWSMNENKPNQGVTVVITFADRAMFERWQQVRAELDLPESYSIGETDLEVDPRLRATVYPQFVEQAGLGKWPGEAPVLPENVVVRVSDD